MYRHIFTASALLLAFTWFPSTQSAPAIPDLETILGLAVQTAVSTIVSGHARRGYNGTTITKPSISESNPDAGNQYAGQGEEVAEDEDDADTHPGYYDEGGDDYNDADDEMASSSEASDPVSSPFANEPATDLPTRHPMAPRSAGVPAMVLGKRAFRPVARPAWPRYAPTSPSLLYYPAPRPTIGWTGYAPVGGLYSRSTLPYAYRW
ncbi:hypothetical protein IWQ60_000549 [Tieghemiomyces parasiticus]|uniref:Uncharacterized protein n=1 Tax=Tieghemiomyces parasiticus TaxID=78921 RepID=A0A9W8AIL9_9FUNG|nr:hypothetical protein IWQ60_000549 [Tieghemiomyces parasiticus]